MVDFEIKLEGLDNLIHALQQLQYSALKVAPDAAEAMGKVAERGIKLQLSRSSHPQRTKTPSSPGMPPSLISGDLRRSVKRTRSYRSGDGQWTVHIAPTAVYARIQELGGWAGRGHRSHLPPRPYVSPALRQAQADIRRAAVQQYKRISSS